nr:XRE family transcriptional regulator [Frankia sp. CIT1]
MSSALGPYTVSPELLAREDMRSALATHDFMSVFLLMRKYDGASQDRIASQVAGMTQGRVSKIMRGEDRVASFDVIERISDGLRVPGRLLRLAPRPWETPAPSRATGLEPGASNPSMIQSGMRRPAGTVPHGQPVHLLIGSSLVVAESFDDRARTMDGDRWYGVPVQQVEGLVTMAARKALRFAVAVGSDTVGPDTIDLVHDEVTRLARAYPVSPLSTILGDLVDLQEATFRLLEARQVSTPQRSLYLLAGAVSGMLAKASHDVGQPQAAMTQARTAYICADNAGHDGLKVWTRGLQSMIAYWAGRHREAVQYAELGADPAQRVHGTATTWLLAQEARSWAVLGAAEQAESAITRADEARERLEPDELDEFGGILTFTRPRQLYYAADARIWVDGASLRAEETASEAIAAYEHADIDERSFSDEAGARADQAWARLTGGNLEGAAESLRPVLDLPADQRIAGIIASVNRIHTALRSGPAGETTAARDLQQEIEAFSAVSAAAALR